MNYLIGTTYRGSLLGSSKLAAWRVFEKVPNSTLEQIKGVHVYGLGDCQGALFITYSDEVYNVGFNGFGPRSQNGSSNEVPVKIEGLSHRKIEKIRVGLDYGIAVSRSGTLYHWGRPVDELNCYGRTLDESNNHSPHQLAGFCHVAKEAVCGESFFAVLTDNRQVFLTGWVDWNDKFYDKRLISPKSVDIVSLACGAQHIAMVSIDGSVFTCGWGGDGQLGYPWEESYGYLNTRKVKLPEPCVQAACGRNSTAFLSRLGSVWACGWNDNFSKLGVSSNEVIVERPLKVQLEGTFKEIASSYWATCSIYAAFSCDESSIFKWGHGCWPSSCQLLQNSSTLDAFIDFPTPHNLGFSELTADEISSLTYNYGSDFDCYILSTSDILFEGMNYVNTDQLIQPYRTEQKILENVNGATLCCNTNCYLGDLDRSKLLEFHSSPPNHVRSFGFTISRLDQKIWRRVFTLTLILSVCLAILSPLLASKGSEPNIGTSTRCVSLREPVSNIDESHSKLGYPFELAFSQLLNNPRFSDITFKLADGILSAHKIVLFSRSEHFHKVLSMNETLSSIDMPQYTVRVFKHYLDYLYKRNHVMLDIKLLLSLNEIARNLNEYALFKYTLSEIKIRITPSTLKCVSRQAYEKSSTELQGIVADYINQLNRNGMVDLIQSLLIPTR